MEPKGTTTRKAIGIVRVSHTDEVDEDQVASLDEQEERIREAAKREKLDLIDVFRERNVSGGTPLEKRDGLRRAVEAVEAGKAKVVIAAYFDRLVRSLNVQRELVDRVEAKGGEVIAVDIGAVTNGSATKKLTSTFLGAVAEYHRDATAERSREGVVAAIRDGKVPWPDVMPGYKRAEDGTLAVDHELAPIVLHAFELRAGGATIREVRDHLHAHGIKRSFSSTRILLASSV
jgi:site-specific DNA recombinase